jgi:hypothetical protein
VKETEKYNKICSLVDTILTINKKLLDTSDSSMRGILEREVKVHQERIDELVYDLYGLNDEEKRIVEALVNPS